MESATESAPIDACPASPPRAGRWRLVRRWVILFAVFYAVWCGVLYYNQDRMLFPAEFAPAPGPMLYNAKTIQLERPIEGGKVVAWFIPAPKLKPGTISPVVIFFHGNAEIIDFQDTIVQGYQKLGCSVLLPEYRGYGRSDGTPSEAAIIDDALYFHDQIIQRHDVDRLRIFFHGRSVGGGPAAGLAIRRTPRVLILESTFTSVAAMARAYFAPSFLVKNAFHVDDILEMLDAPVLIFHGAHDDIIPVGHGHALRDIARRATYVEYDCMHNDFPGSKNEEDYWNRIRSFLSSAEVLSDEPRKSPLRLDRLGMP